MIALWVGVITAAVATFLTMLVLFYWSLLRSLYPERLRTTEVTTLTTGDIWKLRLCRYRKGRTTGEPVLLIHGASSNQHNFTSPEGFSLVDYLVARGYDCWTIDLRGTRSSVAPFEQRRTDATLDGMLLHDLPAALRHIRRSTGYARIHLAGHSLGGMLIYAFVQAFGSEQIASVVTLGTPVGFDALNLRTPRVALFLVKHFPHLCGNLIRGTVPFNLLLRRSPPYFPTNIRNLHPKLHTGHFMALIEDPLPCVAHELAYWAGHKIWRMKRGKLDVAQGLKHMRVPIQAFFAPRDRLVPVAKAKEFFDALPTADKEMHVLSRENGCKEDYNHCDLAFGRYAAHEIYEHVALWLEQHRSAQRISQEELGTDGADFLAPLAPARRAEILSGQSYAHLSQGSLAGIDAPIPRAVEPMLDMQDEALDLMQLAVADMAPSPEPKAPRARKTTGRPAGGKASARRQPAGKTKPPASSGPARPRAAVKKGVKRAVA
ncbi:MAG: alpha/beta fold hydrolase, partial [Candidatus Hydrogenedentes bacterium]|nr:alpha/beta fold hydrolase [Candidatus Hydrogenedentota bacterium]